MTLETFYEHFELLSDAPNAVPKLREMVLQLAVQGKLVESSPRQATDSDFFGRLSQKPSSLIDEVYPFALPESWFWARGFQLLKVIRGVSYAKSQASDSSQDGYLPLLRANNIKGVLNFDSLVYVPHNLISEQQLIRSGDILIAMSSGSKDLVGKAAQAQEDYEGSFGAFCGLLRLIENVHKPYMAWYFQSPLYKRTISALSQGIGINNLRKGYIEGLYIPLPPLEEQKRIVAKVDELMALCDDLEQQQRARAESRSRLNTAFLTGLSSAPDETSFKRAWERVAGGFDMLYTTPETIGDLRKTILQLAVQGKLVRQNPKDDVVSIASQDFIRAKAQLLEKRRTKYRDLAELPSIKGMLFSLPSKWRWFRFGEVVYFQEGPGIRNWQFQTSGVKLLNVSNILPNHSLDFDNSDKYVSESEFKEKYQHFCIEEGDLLFAGSGASWGKTAWFTDPGYLVMMNTSTMRLRFFSDEFYPNYLLYFLQSEFFKAQLAMQLVGMQPNFGSTHLTRSYISIPPIAEQKRIVAKVDELMALVDELEAGLQRAQADAERLLEAVISSLLSLEPKHAVKA